MAHDYHQESEGEDEGMEEIDVSELAVAHVSKSDLKKLLIDFQLQCAETADLHKLLSASESWPMSQPLLRSTVMRVLENQTLILTGLASLLQIQVNHKDAFNEG